MNTSEKHGNRYSSYTMKESINIFLRSRNSYRAIRELVVLRHEKTIKSYFGKLGSPGSLSECASVIKTVFEKV